MFLITMFSEYNEFELLGSVILTLMVDSVCIKPNNSYLKIIRDFASIIIWIVKYDI